MALVSINEASKLTGKSRTTLYKKLNNGELSKTTDERGTVKIDTAELLRVFNTLKKNSPEKIDLQKNEQKLTEENIRLKMENKYLHSLLLEKEDKINILKHSLELLELKTEQLTCTYKKSGGNFLNKINLLRIIIIMLN